MARPRPHKRAARLAAISIISLLGAVAAAWAAPRVSGAVQTWVDTPAVELRTAEVTALPVAAADAGSTGRAAPVRSATRPALTLDAGMKFTMAGVTCTPPSRAGGVVVLLRTSVDGRAWSRWYDLELERASEEGGEEQAFTEPVWTGEGRHVQVAARAAGDGRAPVRLRDVRVVTINSTEDAGPAASVVGVLRRTVASIAGLHLTPGAAAMTTKPAIVTRKEWGANESLRSGSPSYAAVKMCFVHHTASSNSYKASEAPAVVRGVYAYHTRSLRWSDVGYNFLIDRYGTIYEGRYGGMAKGVVGAQVLGFNTGSTGVSIIGTYSDTTPTSRSVVSLERLLEWKLDVHHIDPQGTGTLTCGYGQKFATGQKVKFPAIAGHRDANYTDCPGDRLYAQLPDVRKVVAKTGHPKIYGFIVGDPSISPNGDGVRDRTRIGFTVSQQASWGVEIRNGEGEVVRSMAGEGKVVEVLWDGRDDEGKALPDGGYSLRADATSADGVARSATATLRLDRVPPRIESASVAPNPFSPNGDGQDDVATVTFSPGESGTARVSVVDSAGDVMRRVTGWSAVSTSAQKVRWDGRISGTSGLVGAPEGKAVLLVELRDEAGNPAEVKRSVTVDRTLRLAGVSRKVFSPNGDGVADAVTLSFKLSRAADVSVAVIRSGSTIRTLDLGRLRSGSRSVEWDGKAGASAAGSGTYSLRVTADGALGVTSAAQKVTVDVAAPRVSATSTASVRYRKTARIAYKVRDADSATVKVIATVTDAKGRTAAKLSPGWVRPGESRVLTWKPKGRRTYTVTFRAVDPGGNRQLKPAVTKLRVR